MPIWTPPPQYDHPFRGELFVEVLSIEEVGVQCSRFGPMRESCAIVFIAKDGKKCHIIYPKLSEVEIDDMVQLVRHETAHCNGWPADHTGGF